MNSIRLSSLSAPVSGVFRLVSLLCLALPLLAAPAREVAFVDGAVVDHEVLVAGVRPGVETVRLDPAGDALAQMAAWAETHSGYEAIHVVSHAAPGALRAAAAAGDIVAVREAFGRLRERHPQAAALAPLAHAIENFDTDGLVRLAGPAAGPSPKS